MPVIKCDKCGQEYGVYDGKQAMGINHEDVCKMTDPNNPPAITPKEAQDFLDDIDAGRTPADAIATEYLKLHEENTRLREKNENFRGLLDECANALGYRKLEPREALKEPKE